MRPITIILTIILFISCTNKSVNRTNNVQPQDSGKHSKIKPDSSKLNTKKEQDSLIKFVTPYKFENFKTDIYSGKVAIPDFTNNPYAKDKEYVKFITEGCKENGINFAGHYTIIERGCGAECLHIFIVDRINGKIFTDTKPNDGRYGYKYRKDSRLLVANANLFINDKLEYYYKYYWKPELYEWRISNFVRIK